MKRTYSKQAWSRNAAIEATLPAATRASPSIMQTPQNHTNFLPSKYSTALLRIKCGFD